MNPKTVLIVEDDAILLDALSMLLEMKGLRVIIARQGKEALDVLGHDRPDLIILDLLMPEVDGFSVLRTLHERKNTIPVFVITNLTREEDEAHLRSLGATQYLVKSNLSLDDLWQRMEAVLF